MIDFTFELYKELLDSITISKYQVKTAASYFDNPEDLSLILRHDVDRYPGNALKMASIENEMGIKATYYFRIKRTVFKKDIMQKIIDMGHEIGYHYEDLAINKGDFSNAIHSFKSNLRTFNKLYPIKTICMHGSPISPWDNKRLWDRYDYKEYGIIGDLNLDIDFDEVFYITDNGFGWNRMNSSVRDKVESIYVYNIENTLHLADLIKKGKLPNRIMLNAHPDTFFCFGWKWILNYSVINFKNIFKWLLIKLR